MTSSELSVEGTASVKDPGLGDDIVKVLGYARHCLDGVVSMDDEDEGKDGGSASCQATVKLIDRLLKKIAALGDDQSSILSPTGTVTTSPDGREAEESPSLAAAPSRDQVTMGALREAPAGEALRLLNLVLTRLGELGRDDEAGVRIVLANAIDLLRASLVPTAEQGVVLPPAKPGWTWVMVPEREATWGDSGPVPGVDFGDEFDPCGHRMPDTLTPPIAGAGEELVERLRDAYRHLDLAVDQATADLIAEAAALISQLNSRIGGLERELDQARRLRDHYLDASEAWKSRALGAERRAEAAEAKLAEARELDELAKHITWEVSWGERDPNWEGGECCWLVHERSGNINDREWSLIGYGTTPAEALRRARFFHSPKEPAASGGQP